MPGFVPLLARRVEINWRMIAGSRDRTSDCVSFLKFIDKAIIVVAT